tara:strand:- start:373 stop:930 length:558 start_codon:yes stop_codon:yes gene_type:complete
MASMATPPKPFKDDLINDDFIMLSPGTPPKKKSTKARKKDYKQEKNKHAHSPHSPQNLKKSFKRRSSVTEISEMSPDKLAKYMQRYEKLSVVETFYAKHQVFQRQVSKIGLRLNKASWKLFAKSQYKVCQKTRMSPVGIFMYTETQSQRTKEHFTTDLLTLRVRIGIDDVVLPPEVVIWLNEFHG